MRSLGRSRSRVHQPEPASGYTGVMRLGLPIFLATTGCAPPSGGQGSQSTIQAHLVVHVDPMARTAGAGCEDPQLQGCGPVDFESWHRRTRNLTWLAETWVAQGRTVDLQLGPEAAKAWAGHPATLAVMGDEAESVADEGMCALRHIVGSGQASLGLHMHTVLPDGPGAWGALKVAASDDPCAATQSNPTEEVPADQVEALVHYGATAVHPLSTMLDSPIESFSAHVPRSMATKIAVIEAPDTIDPDTQRSFPLSFQPKHLSTALSECFQHEVDHPPFEAYPSDGLVPLGAGQGPMVIPGNRVVGSMAPHLGRPSDGSLGAARRRLLQLLLNWRVAGLNGEAERPWVYTFHAHLFDLGEGTPDPFERDARLLSANEGHPFREDVAALAQTVDALSSRPTWAGVGGVSGVIEWSLPSDLDVGGSRFGLDPDGENPYLPLVTERLAHSHLQCSDTVDGFDLFQLDRCPGGWVWGGDGYGQHCRDGASPQAVTVIVSAQGGCVPGDSTGVQVGEVDGDSMTSPLRCAAGLRVPPAGLIIERLDGQIWRSDVCAAGHSSVL